MTVQHYADGNEGYFYNYLYKNCEILVLYMS